VRLFEAAASGATIISDNWPGLDAFFTPGREILLPAGPDEVVRYLNESDADELHTIGRRAQERVLAEHTHDHRADQFERAIQQARHASSSVSPAEALASD
jgi:spore maturation protein CgeB